MPGDISIAHVMYRMCADHVRADYFFAVKKWSGEIFNPEPEKCSALDWFPITRLPGDVIPYIRAALERYAAGRLYSEFDETKTH